VLGAVEVEARLDAVDGAHPARDLRFARATVLGVGVARERAPEELLHGDGAQGALAREARDIRGGDAGASRLQPGDAVRRARDDARAVIRGRIAPQGRLRAHPIILPLAARVRRRRAGVLSTRGRNFIRAR
jgi:hypothetical protein